jgi:hypothetical protein
MTLDHKLGSVLSQVAHLHLDRECLPDPSKTSAGVSDAISVTVTELPSPPASPSSGGCPPAVEACEAPPVDGPDSPTRAEPGTFPYFPLLPAELRLKIW